MSDQPVPRALRTHRTTKQKPLNRFMQITRTPMWHPTERKLLTAFLTIYRKACSRAVSKMQNVQKQAHRLIQHNGKIYSASRT
jgi:hypothetical protein